MHQSFVELLSKNAEHAHAFGERFDRVQDAKHPDVVTVCCSDSRVLQDHLWGNDDPGRIFTCSNVGNRVVQRTDNDTVVSGDVLYPIVHTGTATVVVVGHTGCGAVTATYDDLTEGIAEPVGIKQCIDVLRPLLESGVELLPADVDRSGTVNALVEYNVDRQVDFLVESDDVQSDVDVVGVVYDFQDAYSARRGLVHVVNVNGETDVEELRAAYPAIESRIDRLWEHARP